MLTLKTAYNQAYNRNFETCSKMIKWRTSFHANLSLGKLLLWTTWLGEPSIRPGVYHLDSIRRSYTLNNVDKYILSKWKLSWVTQIQKKLNAQPSTLLSSVRSFLESLELVRFPLSLHSVHRSVYKFDFSTPMQRGSPLNISMGRDNKNHRSVPSVLT